MKTKIIIFAMVMAFVSLFATDILCSDMRDRIGMLSKEQSGTFSPGYINAAKQRADDIINQTNSQSQEFVQKSVDRIGNALSDKVAEDAGNVMTPELKKKTGGGEGSGQTRSSESETIITGSEDIPTEDIPQEDISADARNSIQEFLNGQKWDGGDYRIMSAAEGKYTVFWKELDGYGQSLKAQVFDSGGKTMLSDPYSVTGNMKSVGISNVTTLSNGNLAFFWSETGADSKSSLKAQVFDSGGQALLSNPYSITGSMKFVGMSNVTTLSNGNLAVFWSETGADSKYSLKAQVFNSGGQALLSNPYSMANNMSYAGIDDVKMFSNGNLAVFWSETGADSKYSLKAQVFDSGGQALLSNPYSITGSMKFVGMSNVTTLSNGNLAVFWSETGADSKYSLKAQVFNSGGQALLSNSYSMTSNMSYASIDDVKMLSNGNLAVIWREVGSGSKQLLKAQVFDSGGQALLSNPYTMVTSMNLVRVNDVTTLSNGNFAVFWDERGADSRWSLKAQVFDAGGKALLSTPYTAASGNTRAIHMDSMITLSNGNLAVFWKEYQANSLFSLKAQVFDVTGKALFLNPHSIASDMSPTGIDSIVTLSNGNIAIFWNESFFFKQSVKMQILDANGRMLFSNPCVIDNNSTNCFNLISNVVSLSNGNFAVFWNEMGDNFKESLKVQVFDAAGKMLFLNPYSFTSNMDYAEIDDITALSGGSLAIFWKEQGSDSKYSFKSQILDPSGRSIAFDSFSKSIADAAASRLAQGIAYSQLLSSYNAPLYLTSNPVNLPFNLGNGKALADEKALGSIFHGLLANKGMFMPGGEAGADSIMLAKIVKNALGEFSLALPAGAVSPEDMRIASVLAGIMKNPTDEQKLIINAIQMLLQAVENQSDQSASPELKKASDDLLQMAAAILIAQAIPDLFKEGDILTVRNTFSELNSAKSKILLEYGESTKPYYEEIKRILSKNMALLQLNDILSKNITAKELAKLEPGEMDKILEKLRKASNKSFEEEYILQQEAKYRKRYIDPSRKALDGKMKDMMREFTARLSKVLEGAKK